MKEWKIISAVLIGAATLGPVIVKVNEASRYSYADSTPSSHTAAAAPPPPELVQLRDSIIIATPTLVSAPKRETQVPVIPPTPIKPVEAPAKPQVAAANAAAAKPLPTRPKPAESGEQKAVTAPATPKPPEVPAEQPEKRPLLDFLGLSSFLKPKSVDPTPTSVPTRIPEPTLAAPTPTQQPTQIATIVPIINNSAPSSIKTEQPNIERKSFRSLDDYLQYIQPKKTLIKESIKSNPLFGNIVGLSAAQLNEDFDIYYPIYKAGEIQFGIPWSVLWIIHSQETTASRNPNPGSSGYRGAMQIDPGHLNDPFIFQGAKGWEFLRELPRQRYTFENGFATYDFQEILRAAAFMRRTANNLRKSHPELNEEGLVLLVLKEYYSAEKYGQQRFNAYQQLKPVLQR